MAKIITRCEREITDESRVLALMGAVGAASWLEAAMSYDATFLRRFKIVFTPKSSTYCVGYGLS